MKTLCILRHSAFRLFQPSAFRLSGFFLAAFSLQAFSLFCAAQPAAQSVTVTGRVFNVATGFYLRNAEVRVAGTENYVYTDEDGSYAITVPAGMHEITASYSGVLSQTSSVTAAPFAANVLNFDLQPLVVDPAATTAATGAVVMMDRFEVTAEREGQARAIMDQRAAINAVTIIAADNFGDVTMGSVGEILKYMPGISIEYSDDTSVGDATGARIGGLSSKYTTAALDGVAVSTSGRAVNLSDFTSTGIETIEFIQTLTASMDAGSAAGRLNFVSKDPFSRRGPQFNYQFGLNGHSTALNFGGAYLPDDRKHRVIFPSAQLNYGGVFFKRRFAIEANLSYNGTYNSADYHFINYSYRNPAGTANPGYDYMSNDPLIASLSWRPYMAIVNRYGGNLNLGYKITPRLTFSVRSGFFHEERESWSLYYFLRAYHTSGAGISYSPTAGVDRINSTLTHWVVNPVGDGKTHLSTGFIHRNFTTFNRFATPRLTYKHGSFSADLYGGYTGVVKRSRDTERDYFLSADTYLPNIGWTADRPSPDSPTWTLSQTSGDPWGAPENPSKNEFNNLGIRSRPEREQTDQYVGGIDLAYARRIFGVPVTFKAGGLLRRNDYERWAKDNRYNLLGPTGRPQEAIIPYTHNFVYDFSLGGRGGNISDQGWPVAATNALYNMYREHPGWFTGTIDNFQRELTGTRGLSEDISAGYFEVNARVKRLRFNLGARFENTAVETLMLPRLTNQQVIKDGYDLNTEEGVLHQYNDGIHEKRTNSYNNFFFSGGFKYDITRNLQAQVSVSQSILRPDYDNLAGVLFYDTELLYTWIPNNRLKPEYMTKYFASLNWKLEPAGTLSLYGYRMDIKDKQIPNVEITLAEAEAIVGYPLADPEVDAGDDTGSVPPQAVSIFRSTINSPSRLSVYGVTLEYNQQLTFLPGYFKGLSVFSSFTLSSIQGSQIDEDKIGQVKRSANGGVRYRVGRMHLQLRGSWDDTYLAAVTRAMPDNLAFLNGHQYAKGRLIIDLSGGFKLTPHCELTFSIRNLTNSPRIWYSNSPDRLSRYASFGSIWNVSLKGSF